MKSNKIAILATGDEITQGAILNTNAQKIAQAMFSQGLEPQWHMSVPDDIQAIEEALSFLLQKHAVVITIGGLGPTSDDKTRFALSNYLQEPLLIDADSLDFLAKRYQKINIPLTELSRQQAFFPKNATILKNITGSANGCCYRKKEKDQEEQWIFMLPGPPHECLPMFETYVLPELKENYATGNILLQWKVFGVAEGVIANQMDATLKPYLSLCRTSFRWNYPYVDCKVLLRADAPEKTEIIQLLNALFSPYQLDRNNQTATESLKNYLSQIQGTVHIQDFATGGVLESRLRSFANYSTLFFNQKTLTENSTFFQIEGLNNYWKGEENTENELILTTTQGIETTRKVITIPYRKMYLEEYVAELVAHEIYVILSDNDENHKIIE